MVDAVFHPLFEHHRNLIQVIAWDMERRLHLRMRRTTIPRLIESCLAVLPFHHQDPFVTDHHQLTFIVPNLAMPRRWHASNPACLRVS